MQRHFDEELQQLKNDILRMGALAQEAIVRAADALKNRDEAAARKVVDADVEMDRLELAIDDKCLELIALHQPMAVDLRTITAVLHINNDLERIGDQAANIAKRTKNILKMEDVMLPVDFEAMGEHATRMIRLAVQSLIEGDAFLAESVRAMDDEIDRMNRVAHEELLQMIQKRPQFTDQAMIGILIARNLESIADHATSIAADVIFWVRGADVRHEYLATLD